jgi:hypothetical protein
MLDATQFGLSLHMDIPPGVRLKAALSVLQSVASMDESTDDAATLENWRTDVYPYSGV